MTTFTPAIDQALAGNIIRDAEFVKLTITDPQNSTSTSYCVSTSFQNETVTDQNGVSSIAVGTYTGLGGLVNISSHQRDLSVTSYDLQVTLQGIDPNKIRLVLEVGLNPDNMTYHSGIKGAKVQIWRGFYNGNYQLIDTPQLRYTGIVTGYTITENRVDMEDTFILMLKCSSYKSVLENRTAGRHTNGASWNKNINPNYDPATGLPTNPLYDTSMDRVQAIHNTTFNFGLPV
jgi:hypothetical protein